MPRDYQSGLGGLDFGSRVLSNIYALHRRDQDLERENANTSRNSMLGILTAAANSGNVNPEDMPTLIRTLFETASVKPDKKAIDALSQQVQEMFTNPSVTRKGAGTIGPTQTRGSVSSPTPNPYNPNDQSLTTTPEFRVPGVPMPGNTQGPAVRFMTPEQKAMQGTRAEVQRREALLPLELEKIRATYDLKSAMQSDRIDQTAQVKLQEIYAREGARAQRAYNELAVRYKAANYDDDEIPGLVAADLERMFKAKVGRDESTIEVNKQRVLDMQGRLTDTKFRTEQLKRRTDAYIERIKVMNEASTNPKSANKSTVPIFNAMTKELYPELTALNRMITRLETDPNFADPDDPETQQNIAELKARVAEIRTAISEARDQWLPGRTLPDERQGLKVGGKVGSTTPKRSSAKLTEAEIRGSGGTDADVEEARRKGVLATPARPSATPVNPFDFQRP